MGCSRPLAHYGLRKEGITQVPTRPTVAGGRTESPCVRHKCEWTDSKQNIHLFSTCGRTSAHTHTSYCLLKTSGVQALQLTRCSLWSLEELSPGPGQEERHQGGFLEAVAPKPSCIEWLSHGEKERVERQMTQGPLSEGLNGVQPGLSR